jgi:two-component system cell cycle sensor histidine kinase/response regulator CckA
MSTILVVDDDPAFLKETEKMLVDAGYRVLQAPDGLQAVRMLEQFRGNIDLAIVDLALPGVNGFELIGALSRRPNSLKVIATTGIYNNAQLETAAALGAHAAIRKPRVAKALPRRQWLDTIQQLIGTP